MPARGWGPGRCGCCSRGPRGWWRARARRGRSGAACTWWSLDGSTLDVQDTEANWEHFGGPSTKDASGKRLRGAFPQARLLALAECGTRALAAAVTGACSTGEKTLTAGLLPRLGPGMLVLADRNFAGYELWRDAAATGADLLWRIGVSFSLPVRQVLEDGTYLSVLKAPRALRKAGAADITVRVIEYRLEDAAGQVTETFALITTLLDPARAPARELAELYRARWQTETALGAFKTEMKGAGVVLRIQDPRRGRAGDLGAAVRLSRHPGDDLRRRRARPPGPAADLVRQRPGHRTRPGREPGCLSPLTRSPARLC